MEKDILNQLGSGAWMNGFDNDISQALLRCEDLCFQLNNLPPSSIDQRHGIIKKILHTVGERFIIHSPFHCDFGTNIHIGENFVSNYNLTILDEAAVTIGDNVFIGPNCSLCTVVHALHAEQRNAGIMCARPITIGHNVWLATNVTVLPGVSIGDGAVIGAGSVVTRDIPPNVVALGNPCKVVRPIDRFDYIK